MAEFTRRTKSDPRTLVLPATSDWFSLGLLLYDRRTDKGWSLVDCISFEMMRQHDVKKALTYDHHFIQAGFEAILSDSTT